MLNFKKPDYSAVSATCYLDMLIKLLDQLPDLLREIAPGGLDNSIYHHVYYAGLENAYECYTRKKIKEYLTASDKTQIWDEPKMATKTEFLKHYTLGPVNLELKAMAVYISAIVAIFDNHSVIHDNKYNSFEPFLPFSECVFLAVNIRPKAERFYRMDYIFPAHQYEEVDYKPIYCFIFRFLKSQGLDYHYEKLENEFEMSWMYTSQMDERMVPSVVAAYLEVYGHWPEGYL